LLLLLLLIGNSCTIYYNRIETVAANFQDFHEGIGVSYRFRGTSCYHITYSNHDYISGPIPDNYIFAMGPYYTKSWTGYYNRGNGCNRDDYGIDNPVWPSDQMIRPIIKKMHRLGITSIKNLPDSATRIICEPIIISNKIHVIIYAPKNTPCQRKTMADYYFEKALSQDYMIDSEGSNDYMYWLVIRNKE